MELITTLKSRAKVNLFLHINGRLENGYHELESLFYFPDIFDEIEIYESTKQGVEIEGRFSVVLDGDVYENSIITAYNALKKSYGEKIPSLYFKLKKNLPVAAGLGGGSGNAANVIKFLNDKFKLNIDEFRLIELAKKIGADVPPSLYERPCLVSGIGEKISLDVKLPKLFMMLVNPMVAVPTKSIFEMGFASFRRKMNNVQYHFETKEDLISFLRDRTTNDLYENALKICPEIKDVEIMLNNQKGCLLSRMSGSGATMFSIFESRDDMEEATIRINSEKPDYYIACN